MTAQIENRVLLQATWMLNISTISAEQRMGIDLGDVFVASKEYE